MCVGLSQNKLQCVCSWTAVRLIDVFFNSFWTTVEEEEEDISGCDTHTILVRRQEEKYRISPDLSLKRGNCQDSCFSYLDFDSWIVRGFLIKI